jgi:aspartate/methionine/tyrosine aminotransferase
MRIGRVQVASSATGASAAGASESKNQTLPRLARRTGRVEPFRVMEFAKRAQRLEAEGRSIIHLSIGEPDFTAPAPVVAALEAAVRSGKTQYTQALGTPALREAIAQHYRDRWRVAVEPERVVVCAGASAALTLACCALVDPGDEVLLADPGYPCNRNFIAAHDGIARAIPVGAETRFQPTAELVAAHWGPATRGVLAATPANPTGTSIPFSELGQILASVRSRGGFSLIDEIYLGLSYEAEARSVLELGDDMVVTNSFSKFFHMTGWRLGWLVVPPGWVSAFERLAQNLYICPSALAQHAALACFSPAAMAEFDARREAFRARRDWLVPALRRLGFEIPVEPDGAFYIWVNCERFGLDAQTLAEQLLEHAGVSLVPGADFTARDASKWLRVSYATSLAQLEEAVQRMERFFATL